MPAVKLQRLYLPALLGFLLLLPATAMSQSASSTGSSGAEKTPVATGKNGRLCELRRMLNEPTDKLRGGIDPGTDLRDALELIARLCRVEFRMNYRSWKEFLNEDADEVNNKKVQLQPVRERALNAALRDLLEQVEATFLVRQDHIEIIYYKAAVPDRVSKRLASEAGDLVLEGDYVRSDGWLGFTTPVTVLPQGNSAKLVLTGSYTQERSRIKRYSVGSYLLPELAVKLADELANAEEVREKHLTKTAKAIAAADQVKAILFDVEEFGKVQDIIDDLKGGLQTSDPKLFQAELDAFARALLGGQPTYIWRGSITHVPGVGLEVSVSNKSRALIKNPRFAQAVWQFYFDDGDANQARRVKLLSRL